MSAALTEAAAAQYDERTKIARWWRRNACTKHGILYEEDDIKPAQVEVEVKHEHTHKHEGIIPFPGTPSTQSAPPANSVVAATTTPAATTADAKSGIPGWAKILAAGAVGAGLAAPAAWWLSSDKETTVIEKEAVGSMLQYLEDRGDSVPPEGANK